VSELSGGVFDDESKAFLSYFALVRVLAIWKLEVVLWLKHGPSRTVHGVDR